MKIYAVKIGRIPGIYNTWDECKAQTDGFKGGIFKSFSTKDEAIKYLNDDSHSSDADTSDEEISLSKSLSTSNFKSRCIYTDGGHGAYSKDEGWGSVVDAERIDLIGKYLHLFDDMQYKQVQLPVGIRYVLISKFSDVRSQQNNGAELLAMIGGIRISLYTKKYDILYSDSNLCIEYWSKKLGDDKRVTMDSSKVKYIDELIRLRKQYEEKGGCICKIDGHSNLADLGYH